MTSIAKRILENVGQLTIDLRDADKPTLLYVQRKLAEFQEAWVVSGEGEDLPFAPHNACFCLADVDVTDRVLEAVNIRLEHLVEG